MKLRMRIITGFVAGLFIGIIPAQAQVTGWLHSAKPLDSGTTDIGGYVGFFDGGGGSDAPISIFGQIRHGLFATGDGGLKFGLADMDAGGKDVGLVIAADVQWALLAPRWGDPFRLSVGPEISMYNGNGARNWAFGGNLAASHDILIRAKRITIYGRLNLRLEAIDFKKTGKSSHTDLAIGLNPGFIWEVNEFFDLVTELQFDDQIGILAGLNFRI